MVNAIVRSVTGAAVLCLGLSGPPHDGNGVAAASEADGVLVLDARGNEIAERLQPGSTVAVGTEISLVVGETLILLVGGRTVSHVGPKEVVVEAPLEANAANGLSALVDFLRRPRDGRARIGATRSIGRSDDTTTSASTWQLDVSESGIRCVRVDMPAMTLWRGMPAPRSRTSVLHADSGRRAEFIWPNARMTADWPDSLPLEDGLYQFQFGRQRLVEIVVQIVREVPEQTGEVLLMLAAKGCLHQVDGLIDEISAAARGG